MEDKLAVASNNFDSCALLELHNHDLTDEIQAREERDGSSEGIDDVDVSTLS